MTTQLTKPVKRRSNEMRRECGKSRAIVITLYPAGFIGLRLEGLRREEHIPIQATFERAIKMRIASEQLERARKKKAKREGRL